MDPHQTVKQEMDASKITESSMDMKVEEHSLEVELNVKNNISVHIMINLLHGNMI